MDKSRYGAAAGEWLMRDSRCRGGCGLGVAGHVQGKKKTAAKGEMSVMIPFKHCLFSLQVVVKVVALGRPRKSVPVWTQSAVGHFHVSEEKGNKFC